MERREEHSVHTLTLRVARHQSDHDADHLAANVQETNDATVESAPFHMDSVESGVTAVI